YGLQEHVEGCAPGPGRGSEPLAVRGQCLVEIGLAALDDRVVRIEAGVYVFGQLFELLLAVLAETGAHHLVPERRESIGRGYLAAEPAGQEVETLGEGGGVVEPAPGGEGVHAGETLAQLLDTTMLGERGDRFRELGERQVGHPKGLMAAPRRAVNDPSDVLTGALHYHQGGSSMVLDELTGRCLPAMVARGRGAVMNIASLGAFGPGPYMATYVATKAFVLSFSESIAVELKGSGVHVLCVCPGFTRTEFQQKAEVD